MSADPVAAVPALRTAASVFLPFAAAYFVSYFLRSINAIISPDLTEAFALTAAELGLLTAAYFLAFAAFQIPVGLMLDRFGPRRTNASLFLVAACGAALFSVSNSLPMLLLARAMIGAGVSAGLMSSIKVFTLWFPLSRLPAMNGMILFSGGLGAIAATVPVEAALQITDWRGVFGAIAVATFAASAAVFIIVPEREAAGRHETLSQQLTGVAQVFGSARFRRLAAASTLFQAVNMAVQGLWAAPWLSDVAGLARPVVALHLLALGAATMCGFLFWGAAATRLSRRGIAPIMVFKVSTAAYLVIQLLLVFGVTSTTWLIWIGWGFLGTSGSLSFAILSQTFPVAMTGRATTALNLLVFLAAFCVQWGFGAIVNMWPGTHDGHYQPLGYSAAFTLFFVLQLIAFAWMITSREFRKANTKS